MATTTFQRLGDRVKITQGSDIFLVPASSVLRTSPRDENMLLVSDKYDSQADIEGIRIDVREITGISFTDMDDLFTKLAPYFTSDEMAAGRVSAHGEITDLTDAFSLDPEVPFSICIIPKQATTDEQLVVSLKTLFNAAAADMPCQLNDWTPGNIIEIPAAAIDLADYYVYWGCGTKAVEAV